MLPGHERVAARQRQPARPGPECAERGQPGELAVDPERALERQVAAGGAGRQPEVQRWGNQPAAQDGRQAPPGVALGPAVGRRVQARVAGRLAAALDADREAAVAGDGARQAAARLAQAEPGAERPQVPVLDPGVVGRERAVEQGVARLDGGRVVVVVAGGEQDGRLEGGVAAALGPGPDALAPGVVEVVLAQGERGQAVGVRLDVERPGERHRLAPDLGAGAEPGRQARPDRRARGDGLGARLVGGLDRSGQDRPGHGRLGAQPGGLGAVVGQDRPVRDPDAPVPPARRRRPRGGERDVGVEEPGERPGRPERLGQRPGRVDLGQRPLLLGRERDDAGRRQPASDGDRVDRGPVALVERVRHGHVDGVVGQPAADLEPDPGEPQERVARPGLGVHPEVGREPDGLGTDGLAERRELLLQRQLERAHERELDGVAGADRDRDERVGVGEDGQRAGEAGLERVPRPERDVVDQLAAEGARPDQLEHVEPEGARVRRAHEPEPAELDLVVVEVDGLVGGRKELGRERPQVPRPPRARDHLAQPALAVPERRRLALDHGDDLAVGPVGLARVGLGPPRLEPGPPPGLAGDHAAHDVVGRVPRRHHGLAERGDRRRQRDVEPAPGGHGPDGRGVADKADGERVGPGRHGDLEVAGPVGDRPARRPDGLDRRRRQPLAGRGVGHAPPDDGLGLGRGERDDGQQEQRAHGGAADREEETARTGAGAGRLQ